MLNQLKLYIEARYTLIYIQTNEEYRLIKQIRELGFQLNYEVKCWNFDEEPNPISFTNAHWKAEQACPLGDYLFPTV